MGYGHDLYMQEISVKRKITNGSKGYATIYLDKDLIATAGLKKGNKVIVTTKKVEGQDGLFIYKK